MKSKLITVVMLVAVMVACVFGFAACNDKTDGGNDGSKTETTTLRFAAPEGTPALAIAKLVTDNKTLDGNNMEYAVVSPSLIAAEMSGSKADLVIMPVNGGANLINQGADYKLVSIAVNGSLYLVGKSDTAKKLTIADIKGKKIACIGKTGTPGLVFRFVMNKNGVAMVDDVKNVTADNVYVQYVADGNAAKTLLANGTVDFAVVGEPAATAFKGAIGCKAQMNMQDAYAAVAGGEVTTYPQAGLFVKTALSKDAEFMTALFAALDASKTWVNANASEVDAFMKANVYESAVFPAAAIPNCAIDVTKLTDAHKAAIVAFLKNIMPKNAAGTDIDWDNAPIF